MDIQENKLISVVVAAYNIEEYLPRCLDSLAAQTYPFLQIIIVDDGSTDFTGEICDSYAAKYSQMQVIHRTNGGLSVARNTGLAVARGEYIGYVDGDDWIEADMYEKMLAACEKHGADVAICAYREIGNDGFSNVFSKEEYVLSGEEALDIYVCDNKPYHIYNSVWSKLFKRDIIEGVQFPAGKKSEDILYTTHALLHSNTCVFLDEPFYNYVVSREGSIMNQGLADRRFRDEIPFWREQARMLFDAGKEEPAKKAEYYFYRRMLFYYLDFKERKMKKAAKQLSDMLRNEKAHISEVYGNNFVTTGDRVRMKLFMVSPDLYEMLVKIYNKVIIPMRQR